MGISQARLGEHGQVQHEVKGLAVVSLDKMDHFVDSGTVRYQVVTVGLPGVGLPGVGLPVVRIAGCRIAGHPTGTQELECDPMPAT